MPHPRPGSWLSQKESSGRRSRAGSPQAGSYVPGNSCHNNARKEDSRLPYVAWSWRTEAPSWNNVSRRIQHVDPPRKVVASSLPTLESASKGRRIPWALDETTISARGQEKGPAQA